MAGGHNNKRNKRSRNAKARRRRVLGAGTTAGAFFAFGMTPLASAPAAQADVLDVIIDPIINSVLGSITSLDALAGIDPSSALDLGSLALPGTDAASAADLGSLALPVTDAAPSADAASAAAPAADAVSAAPIADSSLAEMFQTDFYLPLHTVLEDWISSPTGEAFDNAINPLFTHFAGETFCGLICNGTAGTEADPTGGNAGLFFGDGGAGYDAAADPGMAGGAGGDAGGIGNGGTAGTAGPAPTAAPAATAVKRLATAASAVTAEPV